MNYGINGIYGMLPLSQSGMLGFQMFQESDMAEFQQFLRETQPGFPWILLSHDFHAALDTMTYYDDASQGFC